MWPFKNYKREAEINRAMFEEMRDQRDKAKHEYELLKSCFNAYLDEYHKGAGIQIVEIKPETPAQRIESAMAEGEMENNRVVSQIKARRSGFNLDNSENGGIIGA